MTRIFKPLVGGDWIVGVVGALQLDVLAARIKTEYDLGVRFEQAPYETARWLERAAEEINASRIASLADRRGPRRRQSLHRAQRLGLRPHDQGLAGLALQRDARAVRRGNGLTRDGAAGVMRCCARFLAALDLARAANRLGVARGGALRRAPPGASCRARSRCDRLCPVRGASCRNHRASGGTAARLAIAGACRDRRSRSR